MYGVSFSKIFPSISFFKNFPNANDEYKEAQLNLPLHSSALTLFVTLSVSSSCSHLLFKRLSCYYLA